MVVHLIPEVSGQSRKRFTASDLKAQGRGILPLGDEGGQSRFNADGHASYNGEGTVGAYSQLPRDGRLEAVVTDATYERQGAKVLGDGLCEQAIITLVGQYLPFCRTLVGQYLPFCRETGITLPIWIFAALTGCQGVMLSTWHGFSDGAIHRDVEFLPEFQVDSPDIDPVSYLRPLFDCLANAVGLERSLNYDEQGNRRERRGW